MWGGSTRSGRCGGFVSSFAASVCVNRPAAPETNASPRTRAAAVFTFVMNMAWSTPSGRKAEAEILRTAKAGGHALERGPEDGVNQQGRQDRHRKRPCTALEDGRSSQSVLMSYCFRLAWVVPCGVVSSGDNSLQAVVRDDTMSGLGRDRS